MADRSNIEWTDATWNVITGCSIASPGCTNCYAMRLAGTRLRHHPSRAGLTRQVKGQHVWTGEVRFNDGWADQPLRWAAPRLIFVVAHGDLFHANVPDEWIDRVLAVMILAKHHVFQVLTKRPDRMLDYFSGGRSLYSRVLYQAGLLRSKRPKLGDVPVDDPGDGHWHRNIWLGASVENQQYADDRRGAMAGLAERGWNTWVSYEPVVGPVDWQGWEFIDWMVCGGERGDRPMHPAWPRAARDFCAAHDIPFHFKQWGDWAHHPEWAHVKETAPYPWRRVDSGLPSVRPALMFRVGHQAAGALLDDVQHRANPASLPG